MLNLKLLKLKKIFHRMPKIDVICMAFVLADGLFMSADCHFLTIDACSVGAVNWLIPLEKRLILYLYCIILVLCTSILLEVYRCWLQNKRLYSTTVFYCLLSGYHAAMNAWPI